MGLPVTFYTSNEEPICQTPDSIIQCQAGTIIYPTDTVPPKFRPLTVSQQTLSSTETMLSDHLMLMMEEISTSSNFENGLLNRLSHNVLICKDNEHCSNHEPFSQHTRREMSRMTLSSTEYFFTWTTMGNILLYIFYGWCAACILQAFLNLLIKLRTQLSTRTHPCSICSCILGCCSSMDAALNPLSLTKLTVDRRLTALEVQMEEKDTFT